MQLDSYLMKPFSRKRFLVATLFLMRKAVGFLIILWGLSKFFSSTFGAFDDAMRESLKAVESAAILSQIQIQNKL